MLMGESVNKYNPRSLDGGAQMKGGPAKGNNFSVPPYAPTTENSASNNNAHAKGKNRSNDNRGPDGLGRVKEGPLF